MRYWLAMGLLFFGVLPVLGQDAKNVRLLVNWNDTVQVKPNAQGSRYNEVWGFVWQGKEYGVIGSTIGAHIIDINTGKQVALGVGADTGAFIVHRDYQTYGHYLYAVCDEGYSKLQVFDYSYLPDSIHLVYESDWHELSRARDIFIDTAKARLYVASAVGLTSGEDFLRVYSLANPVMPVQIGKLNYGDAVSDLYVRNDTAYCDASSFGYLVVDFKDAVAPQIIGGLANYPYQGYNHSCWVNENGLAVMSDETLGYPVKVLDVREPDNISITGMFSPRPGDNTCIPHNPYLVGHFAFVSYYFDGLQIYDLSDPAHPVQAGYYDTYPGPAFQGFSGAWGCYPFLPSHRVLVSDMQTGLYVLDAREATGDTIQAAAATVYPNPADDAINVGLPRFTTAPVAVTIYNSMGAVVLRTTLLPVNDAVLLPLPRRWPAGWYGLRLSAGTWHQTTAFIKR